MRVYPCTIVKYSIHFARFPFISKKEREQEINFPLPPLFRMLSLHNSYGPARRFEITKHPQDCMNTVPELFEATFSSKSTCASTLSSLPSFLPSSKSHLSLKRTLRTRMQDS